MANIEKLITKEMATELLSVSKRTIDNWIAEINRQGVTIILIEHNLGEVMRICQRLVVLDNGRRIADGPPRDVMAQPQVRAAYLGTDAPAESTEEHGA
ncbi:ABC transporter ATP-binding protein C-terminal domain-containing protein [Eoetvoesiella caeni]